MSLDLVITLSILSFPVWLSTPFPQLSPTQSATAAVTSSSVPLSIYVCICVYIYIYIYVYIFIFLLVYCSTCQILAVTAIITILLVPVFLVSLPLWIFPCCVVFVICILHLFLGFPAQLRLLFIFSITTLAIHLLPPDCCCSTFGSSTPYTSILWHIVTLTSTAKDDCANKETKLCPLARAHYLRRVDTQMQLFCWLLITIFIQSCRNRSSPGCRKSFGHDNTFTFLNFW